jgi:arginyl-tRNA synthetase
LKDQVAALFAQALDALATEAADEVLPRSREVRIAVERTRDPAHGDFACNLAMALAKQVGMKPRELAERLVAAFPRSPLIAKLEIAGPGFINVFLVSGAQQALIAQILDAGAAFGRAPPADGRVVPRKVLIEFVSANPTGPMHVGHGRNAAYGDALANILDAAGLAVTREYYINDAGRQADILGISLWLRYLERHGEPVAFPANAYPGDYVKQSAEKLHAAHGARFVRPWAEAHAGVPPDEPAGGDKDAHADGLIENMKRLLGADYAVLRQFGLDEQMADIRATLDSFGVRFDRFQSERALLDAGAIEHGIEALKAKGFVYEKDGATWLATEKLGDEKDRVLVRADGAHTYFAADVAYHVAKVERGYDLLIEVWGADHHGYIARVRAAIEALAGRGKDFEVALIQFVTLASGRMGKRSGNFVTLKDLVAEAGKDATRYFYLNRSNDQHLEFDVELARSQSNDNPVFYVQYAHARVCSVFRQLAEKGLAWDAANGRDHLALLTAEHEQDLLRTLARYPEVVKLAARERAPHHLPHYLREVANGLHTYYNAQKFIVDEAALRDARLCLIAATRVVIQNGLKLLGVTAPESM